MRQSIPLETLTEMENQMGISKASVLSLMAVSVIMAGCQSSRMGTDNNLTPAAPPPVRAAPQGVVQKSNLNNPDASQFPNAPGTDGQSGNTQVASLPPESSPDVTVGSVAGVWTASIGGETCRVVTPQTKYGQGYRAGPLRCPGELANLGSWAVNGKQLVLYDKAGGTVASLYSAGEGRFNGQTTGGQAVSLSR